MPEVTMFCGPTWDLTVDMKTERPVDLYVDQGWKNYRGGSAYKILYVCEPRAILRSMPWVAFAMHRLFDAILTHDEEILRLCPNAHRFEFGTTWVPEGVRLEKDFSVSMVVGWKRSAPGHRLRHEIWQQQSAIAVPRRFFRSKYSGPGPVDAPILGESKLPLFTSQFHVTIENSQQGYYFTEKVMDCFRTRTVPLYWGCPHIADYFNPQGMILVQDAAEAIRACNTLTPELYEKMLPAVEDNFRRSEQYVDVVPRLRRKIRELLGSSA
jgi:hypothetical protein